MTDSVDTQPAFVPKFYEMDPEVDDLLPDGTCLRDGMVVLIEDSLIRADEERADSKWELARLREVNRWCEVSHVLITPRHDGSRPLIQFIGIYPDGTKRKRTYDSSYAWLVRLFSITDGEVTA